MNAPAAKGEQSAEVFGHPKGLAILFGTELWERFNYYGMRAILVLYLVKYLLLPGQVEHIAGYGAIKSILEAAFGPLGVQPLASHIYGIYSALAYGTPLIGGWIADRYWGQRRSVYVGCVLMAAGEFMLCVESLFFVALFVLILGNGCFKPNIVTQVGTLYAPGDSRRDRAYSIFYVGINLGAFLAPLVAGTLGEKAGWNYGFAAAGVGMLIGLAIYAWGQRHLPPERRQREEIINAKNQPLSKEEWRAILALILIIIPVIFFWATYEQQGNTIALWADGFTNRHITLFGWTAEIPTTWFQAVNPLMIFLFTPMVVAFWTLQNRRGTEPSTVAKMAIGCGLIGLAYGIMAVAAWTAGDGKASWLWLVLYFAVLTTGELYVSPVGLSLFSKVAPLRLVSTMMGFWYLAVFAGNYLSGYIGSFFSTMDKPSFFLMNAVIILGASMVIAAFVRPLKPILR